MRSYLIAMGLALCAPGAHALNKCTDSKTGKVTYSDTACPSAQSNTKMEWAPKATTNVVDSPARVRSVEPDPSARGPAEASQLIDLYKRWIDAEKLASSTSRIALAGPVGALQELRRQAEGLRPASCLADAHKSLVSLVGASVDGYISFMRHDRDLGSSVYQLVDRDKLVRAFEADLGSATCKA